MSSLVIPAFIWHSAPSFTTSASCLSYDLSRLYTGSDKGIICIWTFNVKKEPVRVEPAIVLLAGELPITALEHGKYQNEIKDVLIASSSDGTVSIWNAKDGQCLAMKSHALKCNPTRLKMLPDQQHVAASGHSLVVEVLNLETLKVVRRMHGHEDWIACIDWFWRDNSPAIMSMSADSTVRIWLSGEAAKKSDLFDLPIQAALLDLSPHTLASSASAPNLAINSTTTTQKAPSSVPVAAGGKADRPIHAQISPNGAAMLVVVAGRCKVFTMGTFRFIWSVEPPEGATAVWGGFVDDYSVLIWNKRGQAFLHRLPKATIKAIDADRQKSRPSSTLPTAADSTDTPGPSARPPTAKFAPVPGPFPSGEGPGSTGSLLAVLSLRPGTVAAMNDLTFGLAKNLVYLCHDQGHVALWVLPMALERDKIPYTLQPLRHAHFADGWPTAEPSAPVAALPPNRDEPNLGQSAVVSASGSVDGLIERSEARFVTASLVVERELQMICGYSDGAISLARLPADSSPHTWQAHAAKVNCLLLLRKEKNYLISGANDFYIKVWDLSPGPSGEHRLVHVFANHSGPVRQLFMADPQDLPKPWRHRFFSIGEDRSVALFQLDSAPHCINIYGTHAAPISFVKWRPEQDYLLVACSDGSLSLWEISSGQLESTLYGEAVKDILEGAQHLSREDKQQHLRTISKQAITGTTLQLKRDSPVQAIFLNVKLLTFELNHALRLYLPAAATAQQLRGSLTVSSATVSGGPSRPGAAVGLSTSTSALLPPAHSLQALAVPPAATTAMRAALHSAAYRVCTYLLPWGVDPGLDHSVISGLHLRPPKPAISYGAIGVGGRLSILVPKACETGGRWTLSDSFTASHSLAATAIANALMAYDEEKEAVNLLLAFVLGGYLPDKIAGYIDPSLAILSNFWQDGQDDIMTATRSLFTSVIKHRLDDEARKQLAWTWANTLRSLSNGPPLSVPVTASPQRGASSATGPGTPGPSTPQRPHPPSTSSTPSTPGTPTSSTGSVSTPVTPTSPPGGSASGSALNASAETAARVRLRSQAVVVLAILGTEYPQSLASPADLASQVCAELLALIFEESPTNRLRATAAEMLGAGFDSIWKQIIGESFANIIHKLLRLTMQSEPKGLAKTVKNTISTLASNQPRRFIQAIGQRLTDASPTLPNKRNPASDALGPKEHAQALVLLGRLVKKLPLLYLAELPLLVESVVRSLDPHVHMLREVALKPATTLVHDLVTIYPSAAFDQEEQRLAVGTKEGPILIYDLNSATRWHVLEGHKAPITALAFNEKGNMLASYTLLGGEVKIWKTQQLLFGILGSDPHCVQTHQTLAPPSPITAAEIGGKQLIERCKLVWLDRKTVSLWTKWGMETPSKDKLSASSATITGGVVQEQRWTI